MSKCQTKIKITSRDKCFNCGKLGHFGRDYTISNICKKNKSDKLSNNNQQ